MDALKHLTRLGDEALGPCLKCGKVMLGSGLPVFYRVTVEHCGIDKAVIDRHVGLAMTLGGGADGLALASVMGPGEKPVVVLGSGAVNICGPCSLSWVDFLELAHASLETKATSQ